MPGLARCAAGIMALPRPAAKGRFSQRVAMTARHSSPLYLLPWIFARFGLATISANVAGLDLAEKKPVPPNGGVHVESDSSEAAAVVGRRWACRNHHHRASGAGAGSARGDRERPAPEGNHRVGRVHRAVR